MTPIAGRATRGMSCYWERGHEEKSKERKVRRGDYRTLNNDG
jgi:hypothetical protein